MKYLLVFFMFSTIVLTAQDNPVELGNVTWLRDYDTALKQAKKTDKDVFILFQEVPGCSTCRNYGNDLLTHPLIVEMIENEFVPLAIHNNKGGKDAEILNHYGEPSWNNPVARIVDSKGKDRINRIASTYTPEGLVKAMNTALLKRNNKIPGYAELLEQEFSSSTAEAVLGMYCFWSGEKHIGNLNGVISTEAGFMGGHEVVKIKYDPSITNATSISRSSKKVKCADLAFTDDRTEKKELKKTLGQETKPISSYRKDKEDKYYLSKSKYRYVPMTSSQATKINSYLAQGLDANHWLSPKQAALIKSNINKAPVVYQDELRSAWKTTFGKG